MDNLDDGHNDEIDLRQLLSVLWAGKWIIAATTFLAAVISVAVALYLPNIYEADALLAPAKTQEEGGLNAIASQYSGLANLAGINLNGGGRVDETQYAIEVLKSRKFFAEFLQKHDALVDLMAVKGWDRSTGKSIIDDEIYDEKSNKWIRDVSPPLTPKPSVQEAHRVFLDHLSVHKDDVTGFVTISFEHLSPITAKQWVDWLVADINETLRDQDITEAQRAISYLNEKLKRTNVADLTKVFSDLIEEQIRTVMLANVREEYALKTIDPAVVPEERVKPNRALIAVIGTFLGGLIGCLLAFLWYTFRSSPRSARNP